MDFIFMIIFCDLFVPCKPKYCKVCCVTGSVLVFFAEFCPWMTDMKEVKEEEEGLLERKASRLVRLTKPTSNYRHIGIFLQKKPKIKYF